MAFRRTGTQTIFQKRITQQGLVEEDLLWSGEAFSPSGKFKLQFFSGRQNAAHYVKMLNDLSLSQEGGRLCGEERISHQDNADIHNATITKYLLEQKIRLLDHPACSSDLNRIENL